VATLVGSALTFVNARGLAARCALTQINRRRRRCSHIFLVQRELTRTSIGGTTMRTGLSLSIAAGAVALALLTPVAGAGAVTLPGASGVPAAAQDIGAVEQARTVCRRYWTGHRWRTRCWWAPGYHYWGPRPYYRHRYYRHHRRW
jgi:hypothetical protein